MEKRKNTREESEALYRRMVASHADAVLKGATIPYTSLNGHMYSFLSKNGLVALRLPEGERISFITKYKTTLVEQYGIVQKEYVVVPDRLLKKTNELKRYFAISYAYVNQLKPKASAKGKKKNQS
jgi:hypothetical protein